MKLAIMIFALANCLATRARDPFHLPTKDKTKDAFQLKLKCICGDSNSYHAFISHGQTKAVLVEIGSSVDDWFVKDISSSCVTLEHREKSMCKKLTFNE